MNLSSWSEGRPLLEKFNDQILHALGGSPYRHIMLIDGNDDRRIDVAIMTGKHYPLVRLRSHGDDRDGDDATIFSRDGPEFTVQTPSGHELLISA